MLPLILLASIACVPKSVVNRIETLEGQVASLEKEVARLNDQPARPTAGMRPTVDADLEQQAGDQLKAAMDAANKLDWTTAQQLCTSGALQFGATQTWQRRARICDEAAVVGKPSVPLDVELWFQGSPPPASDTQLLVFWEQWCPHCKREMPLVQELVDQHPGEITVVALTKVNRSSSEEKVRAFIAEKGLRFAVAKERNGSLSQYYNVSGVPAAAIVKDGVVIWRGHPAALQRDNTLRDVLASRGPTGNR